MQWIFWLGFFPANENPYRGRHRTSGFFNELREHWRYFWEDWRNTDRYLSAWNAALDVRFYSGPILEVSMPLTRAYNRRNRKGKK